MYALNPTPEPFTFYLGTHQPHWLARTDVPLFVSRRRLAEYKTLPRAIGPWAQDSGGFTELAMHGRWTLSAAQYAADTRRYFWEVGLMAFAAPQDWMCEPSMLARTGLSVRQHQERTTDNYGELVALAPDLPWMPVLQGWALGDYLRHVEDYDRVGVDLRTVARVGVGSVCRRQSTEEAAAIFGALHGLGLSLHGFGVKTGGLMAAHSYLDSADSMAWSFHARKSPPLPGHTTHKNCANCLPFALQWRDRLCSRPVQLRLL